MILPAATLDELQSIIERAAPYLDTVERNTWFTRASGLLPRLDESPAIDLPVLRLEPAGREIEQRHGVDGRAACAAALVAHLAVGLSERVSTMVLPDSVVELYPDTIARLATHLATADLSEYWTGDDDFLKDVRIVAGYSVPCGAQDVDLHSTISRRSGLKSIVTQRDVRAGARVIGIGGPPWFGIHTDSRFTGDFNEAGWERCYLRIADLLESRPAVKGMVGTSWFYDPQLPAISPRLGYLQSTPIDNGAFVVRHGPGAIHTERATATSPTRRELYEQGRYLPVCCSLIWPREALLRWAKRQTAG